MCPPGTREEPDRPAGHRFHTTQWTLVLAAGDMRDPDCRHALATLCEAYWQPVYAYVRRRGYRRPDAEDLTQGFFTRLVEKKSLRAAAPERGRFRSFLLAAIKNYLANEWDRARAEKRGGGKAPLSLDFDDAESRFKLEAVTWKTPERAFLKQWTRTLLDQVLADLGGEMGRKGQRDRFEVLRGVLTGEDGGIRYQEAATRLEMSEAAVKVAVHRLRKRFGELLRARVADTVASPEEVQDEITFLLEAAGPDG